MALEETKKGKQRKEALYVYACMRRLGLAVLFGVLFCSMLWFCGVGRRRCLFMLAFMVNVLIGVFIYSRSHRLVPLVPADRRSLYLG